MNFQGLNSYYFKFCDNMWLKGDLIRLWFYNLISGDVVLENKDQGHGPKLMIFFWFNKLNRKVMYT